MAEKSYLKRQIRLVALNANDLFTNEEYAVYMEICALMNEIDKLVEKRYRKWVKQCSR